MSRHKGSDAAKKGRRRPRHGGAGADGTPERIRKKVCEQELFRRQLELVKLQEWIKHRQIKAAEGRRPPRPPERGGPGSSWATRCLAT